MILIKTSHVMSLVENNKFVINFNLFSFNLLNLKIDFLFLNKPILSHLFKMPQIEIYEINEKKIFYLYSHMIILFFHFYSEFFDANFFLQRSIYKNTKI